MCGMIKHLHQKKTILSNPWKVSFKKMNLNGNSKTLGDDTLIDFLMGKSIAKLCQSSSLDRYSILNWQKTVKIKDKLKSDDVFNYKLLSNNFSMVWWYNVQFNSDWSRRCVLQQFILHWLAIGRFERSSSSKTCVNWRSNPLLLLQTQLQKQL